MEFKISETKTAILYMLNNKDFHLEVKLIQEDAHIHLVDLSPATFAYVTEAKERTTLALLVTTDNGILLVRARYKTEHPEKRTVCLHDLRVIHKVQRRRFARIPFLGDVIYLPLREEVLEHIDEENLQKAVVSMGKDVFCTDISISGLSINTAEELPEKSLLGLTIFNLNELPSLFAFGRVVYSRKLNDGYLVGIDLALNTPEKKQVLANEFVKVQRRYLQLISRER